RERNEAAAREGRPPGYDGRCRDLSLDARAALRAEGRPRSIRFRTPDSGRSEFDDVIRGEVGVDWATISDFVIVRSNGTPVFFLTRVNQSAATFDAKKLEWMNGEHIRRMELADVAGDALPFARKRYGARLDMRTFEQAVELAQKRSTKLVQIAEQAEFLFVD